MPEKSTKASTGQSQQTDLDAASQIQRLAMNFLNQARVLDDDMERLDFLALMLYCTYVSQNAALLGIGDFDASYSVAEAAENLGNSYVPKEFIDYYGSLSSEEVALPSFESDDFAVSNPLQLILLWLEAVGGNEAFFADSDNFSAAQGIVSVLNASGTNAVGGRLVGDYFSSESFSELVVSLGEVSDRTVLDFVCGAGTFLACAEKAGASEVFGLETSPTMALFARIMTFFGNPRCPATIQEGSALTDNVALPSEVDRILLAPPIGTQLETSPGSEEDDYAKAVRQEFFEDDSMHFSQFEGFCIAKALQHLKEDGKAVVQVLSSFLFKLNKNQKAVRKTLVESGCLHAVIELPGGSYVATGVETALLILGPKGSADDTLIVDLNSRELNGKDLFEKGRGRECVYTEKGIDWIADIVANRKEVKRVSALVSPDDFEGKDYDFSYSVYGDIVDYDAMLEDARSPESIMDEIDEVRAEADRMGTEIKKLIGALEKESK